MSPWQYSPLAGLSASSASKAPRPSITPVAVHLQRFAERAWRRPVQKEELEDYLQSYRTEHEAGEKTADAYRIALQGVLTSRNFIYLVEGRSSGSPAAKPTGNSPRGSRISSGVRRPTTPLFTAAQDGALSGAGLRKEVDRILSDSRINRFIDDFSRQWLQLHRVGMFPPDKKLYPGYDDWLETSMRAEPVEYFREMLTKNLPIEGFLDSDWIMANARLCDFYGLPEPKTGGFQRVSLKPENHRGGLLTIGRGARVDLGRNAPPSGASRRLGQ